jgi:hypothetical protein
MASAIRMSLQVCGLLLTQLTLSQPFRLPFRHLLLSKAEGFKSASTVGFDNCAGAIDGVFT